MAPQPLFDIAPPPDPRVLINYCFLYSLREWFDNYYTYLETFRLSQKGDSKAAKRMSDLSALLCRCPFCTFVCPYFGEKDESNVTFTITLRVRFQKEAQDLWTSFHELQNRVLRWEEEAGPLTRPRRLRPVPCGRVGGAFPLQGQICRNEVTKLRECPSIDIVNGVLCRAYSPYTVTTGSYLSLDYQKKFNQWIRQLWVQKDTVAKMDGQAEKDTLPYINLFKRLHPQECQVFYKCRRLLSLLKVFEAKIQPSSLPTPGTKEEDISRETLLDAESLDVMVDVDGVESADEREDLDIISAGESKRSVMIPSIEDIEKDFWSGSDEKEAFENFWIFCMEDEKKVMESTE